MKIYNLIELLDANVLSVENFVVFEEQLSEDVLEECKTAFESLVRENCGSDFSQEDLEIWFKERYWEDDNGYRIQVVISHFQ